MLKKGWAERREDRKIEKGGQWGSDGGRFEEARIIEMLDQKWNKMNDMASNPEDIVSMSAMLTVPVDEHAKNSILRHPFDEAFRASCYR